MLTEAHAAVERFGPSDNAVLAAAWERIQDVEWFRGRLNASRVAAEQAYIFAERLGDVRRQGEAQSIVGASRYFGSEPIDVCIEHAHISIEWAREHGALSYEAMATFALGNLNMEQQRLEEGREKRERALASLRDLGMRLSEASLKGAISPMVGLRAIEQEALLKRLRWSYETLEEADETGALSTVAANLAVSLYEVGEYEEAERLSRESEEAGAPDDVVTQILWRVARAMVIARRGQLEEAETLAREAVTRGLASEYVDSLAEAYLSLGEVLRLAERPEEAHKAIESALEIFERKGFALSADAVRAKLDQLQSAGSPSQ
jgi:tetratricopeptide (TPR) repeat protein